MYSNIQKFISLFLIFFLLASFSFRVPFIWILSYTFAKQAPFFNIVSIIVEEDIYNSIKPEIDTYSKDIQWVLENTRVVVLPTPKKSTSFEIASLNEWLYYEWLKSIKPSTSFESKLIWTVLIWELPIPIVFNKNNSIKSIVPYTDFEDKLYIWDNESSKYTLSEDNEKWLGSEIWHGVISPNKWNKWANILAIKDYFSKNHDFYKWTWNFQTSVWVLNWNNSESIPTNYEPYVFYFDQIRESKAVVYDNYISYNQYLENKEDLTYNRFNNDLANKLQWWVIKNSNKEIWQMIKNLDPTFNPASMWDWVDLTNTPDIQSRHVIKSYTKNMLEIFNQSALGEFKKNVHNAWRYNKTNKKVNVDTPSFIISSLDTVNTEIIKSINNVLEQQIDNLVKGGLSRKIAIPTLKRQAYNYRYNFRTVRGSSLNDTGVCEKQYTNFLYWKQASNITNASECTIYRWSTENGWTLVEANRWLNTNLAQADANLCWPRLQVSWAKVVWWLNWYWWGNSPLSLGWNTVWAKLTIGSHDLKWWIVPVFDIKWSSEVTNSALIPDPRDCFNNNYLLTRNNSENRRTWCYVSYSVPINSQPAIAWDCRTTNQKHGFPKTFDQNYVAPSWNIYLDWTIVKNKTVPRGSIADSYYYKKITSYIFHKSPNAGEIWSEISAMVSPSLAIDKNRYVDFIWAKWNYARIDYPQLLRVNNTSENLDLATVKNVIKTYLDAKSLEVNTAINNSNPASLLWNDRAIYNLLQNWAFPTSNIDFYSYLSNKPNKNYAIDWETKTANYVDTIAFALYWNNLTSISAKYKFVFENYLSDEIWWSPYDFHLVKNKKLYEIAYLWAPWDAQNMYVKLDPEEKADNPYPNVISDNSLLNNQLLASNVANTHTNKWLDWWNSNSNASTNFNCSPPEWVPIYEWFPAVVCRLWDLLPPKISISDWVCWAWILWSDWEWEYWWLWSWTSESFFTDEEKKEIQECKWDVNKNWINDCIESKLTSWSLTLVSDSNKYYYNRFWQLKAEILDKNGKVVKLDSSTNISFVLDKIEAPKDSTQTFDSSNRKIIYDSTKINEWSKQEVKKYISFTEKEIKASWGSANYNFSSKNKDSNIFFKAVINLEDKDWNITNALTSTPIEIKIRWDKLFLNSSKLINWSNETEDIWYSAKVSSSFNLFLTNVDSKQLENINPLINSSSQAKEKIVLNLENISKDWNNLGINYPLKLKIIKDSVQILEESVIKNGDISTFEWLQAISKAWIYDIEIIDSQGLKVSKQIDFTPDTPYELDITLWTSIIENWWNITTNLVTVLDKFWNIVSWEFYNLDININWNSLKFEENWKSNISYKLYEWYKAFRLQSTTSVVNNVNDISFSLKDKDNNTVLSKNVSVKTLSNIKLDITNPSNLLKVWWEKAKFNIIVKDSGWNVLSDFNSRIYIVVPKIYWQATTPYVNVVNWRAEVEFITSIVAWKNIPIEFQVEWLNQIYTKNITINPEIPIKVDLAISENKIEASPSESSFLTVDLKDRFWNIVFNDSSSKIELEILPEYSSIVTTPIVTKTLNEWKTSYYIYGTDLPGQAFFKVKTVPDISWNSFKMEWQRPFDIWEVTPIWWMISSWNLTNLWQKLFREENWQFMSRFWSKELMLWNTTFNTLNALQKNQIESLYDKTNFITISWVWENIWKIETFFFWNKDKIKNSKYNSLYTTLIWAPYWDITKPWYLAWWLIFDKNNRNLTVTSLLNNSSKYDDVISIMPEWWVKSVYSSSTLTQDISYNVWFENKQLYLGLFNESLNTFIWKILFNFDNTVDLKSCIWETRDFNDCWIKNEKTFILLKSLNLDYTTYLQNGKLTLKNQFWKILLEINKKWEIERKWSINIELNKKHNNNYSIFDIKSWNETIWMLWFKFSNWKVIFSRNESQFNATKTSSKNSILWLIKTTSYWTRDNVGTNGTIKNIFYNDPFSDKKQLNDFSTWDENSYENFVNKWWLWWEWWNKTLLSFSAWNSVWEATRDNMSFSLINIWDPVVSLKKIQRKLPWTLLDRSFDSTLWKLISKDYDNISYRVFDYNNDKKEDILILKRDNSFHLLENKDIQWEFLDKWSLITISDLWDKDLVQVWNFSWDWFWSIFFVNRHWKPFILKNTNKDFVRVPLENIFNLWWAVIKSKSFDMDGDNIDDIFTLDDSWEINIFYWNSSYNFTKKTIWSWYWIKLDKQSRNDLAYIYFDSLHQLDQLWVPSDNVEINEDRLDNLIFTNIPYISSSWSLNTQKDKQNNLLASVPNLTSPEIAWWISETNKALLNFTNNNENYLNYTWVWNSSENTTFIKSEYWESVWIKTNKIFNDENGWFLVSWDLIKVDVSVKNTSTSTLKNLAYIDNIPELFVLVKDSLVINNTGAIQKNPPLWFDLLVNGFSLNPNQELNLTYYIKTLAIKHSFIQVWLFEDWEVWDDQFWDIILKKNEENCSENTRIYRSISNRGYQEWIRTPTCDSWKSKLPSELDKNSIDINNNWVPDYIDLLQSNQAEMKKYSDNELAKLNIDSDGDWIPDKEDSAPSFNNDDGSLLDSLDKINSLANNVSEQLDTFIDWLGCWFWWWWCFSLPLNWAPLAPWNDPVLFWKLIGDWLNVEEWLPIFSALTWIWAWPACVPSVWPASPLSTWCSWLWAGWWLWASNPTNFFRVFITPTITWAIWTAICFWWPANLAWVWVWCTPPPWIWVSSDCLSAPIWWPFIPYWNCIVAAQPLSSCSGDWSDWDPWSIWEVQSSSSWYNWNIFWNTWNFWILNWNCSTSSKKKATKIVDLGFVKDYLDYKGSWIQTASLVTNYDTVMQSLSSPSSWWNAFINLDGWVPGDDMELSVEVDTESLLSWDFSDALDIKMERTWWFPDFLMSWVTRQIEEIKTKLTDWPTIYIILPDFSWLFDWWDNFMWWLWDAYDSWKNERENEEARLQLQIDSLKTNKSTLDCSWVDFWKCLALDSDIAKNELLQDWWISFAWTDKWVSSMRKWAWWIESVYKFLSNTPLIDIRQEIVYINIPWIDSVDIEKAISDWKLKKKQWEDEIDRAWNEWSLWWACNQTDPVLKKKCQDQNSLNNKISLDADLLLNSLEKNIEILEWYKNFPKDLYKLIKTKEFYLEQIICNLDSIASLVWGRIWDNWTRFKAWVELYITIKAILKSWQLLVDIFIDYDAECHQCKNERNDSLYIQFKVIDLLIPDIPVIQFPKWPDIIIDLHNIRVNLQIFLPEFKFNFRPIVLPQLPSLYLPKLPNVNLKLPELPLLPELTLPTLPELPSLPTVELPNLPPPPTLPKLFSSLEVILDIIKLLVKILCILKSSPLVPEWRAWDQIAFITERQWYLSFDFLDISLPQFSFPFVDAIKVTSYVNLEYDNEFMVELARQALSPINSITNNVSNMFDIHFSDLDFSWYTPDDINIWFNEKEFNETINKNAFAIYASKRIMDLVTYIDENKDVEVSSNDFISLVNKSLASKSVVSNPKYDELRNLWSTVAEMTYSKEDKLIKELQDTNTEKFDAIKDILKNEIELNKQLWKEVTKINTNGVKKVSFENNSNIKEYNKTLDKYNAKFLKSAIDLVYWKDEWEEEIKKIWNKLVSQLEKWVSSFSKENLEPTDKKLLSAVWTVVPSNSPAVTSCQAQANSDYKYDYKWLLVLESSRSYKLFDYIDILNWDEKTKAIDFDEDWDDDLIYMVKNEIYLKQNLTKKKNKSYSTGQPIEIKSSNNKFYNNSIFYESVNNVRKMWTSDWYIDVAFNWSTNSKINNYRLEFYTIVDKWLNKENNLYTPKNIKKNVIDSFSNVENITMPMEKTDSFTLRKNLAYIKYVWLVPWVTLETKSLINIKSELIAGKIVNISRWTNIYSSNKSSFSIQYTMWESNVIKSKFIAKNQNIVFNESIKVVSISWDAYIEWLENIKLSWLNIRNYEWLPILTWASILADNEVPRSTSSHIDIEYYDGSEMIMDLRDTSSYHLYNLWIKTTDYTIRVKNKNDFYYWKMRSFSDWIFSTYSRSILSSPQKESDLTAPENNIRNIDIPIFQKKEIDLTNFIFENWWIENIKDVFIDFNLEKDTSADWKPKNDRDSDDTKYNIKVSRNEVSVKLLFWPYNELVNQKIWITILDENDNAWYKEVQFNVIAPTLSISEYDNNLIKWNVNNDFNAIPISFFRFRWWSILPLENKIWDKETYSFDEWKFSFQLDNVIPWLNVKQNWSKVADINENTWKISTNSQVNVFPSNHINNNVGFPKIEIIEAWKPIYTQYIQLLNSPLINIVDDLTSLSELDKEWIYIKLVDKVSYSYYKIPEWVLYNPWTLVIYKNSDSSKKALFTIFKDWRINTLDNNYKLVYSTEWEYIKLILKDNSNTVAELLLNIDWWFVIN